MNQTDRQVAAVKRITYHVPEKTVGNAELAEAYPDWNVAKIYSKTGISVRPITEDDETASDLAVAAAEKLFATGCVKREEIDLLCFCTQTPDYVLPTTACMIQDRLGLSTTCAAFDFNLGCSGYVYGLSIVKGMIESGQAKKALLLTGETYSKWIHPEGRTVRTIFGDAGAATLIEAQPANDENPPIGPFVFGTDGTGAKNLIVYESGARKLTEEEKEELPETCLPGYLYMNGQRIFIFTVETVPATFQRLMNLTGKTIDDVDYAIFHQANRFMLDHLKSRCDIPDEKFVMRIEKYGNTVSNTIPIALAGMQDEGILKPGTKLALVGFGVGYSWGACLLNWTG